MMKSSISVVGFAGGSDFTLTYFINLVGADPVAVVGHSVSDGRRFAPGLGRCGESSIPGVGFAGGSDFVAKVGNFVSGGRHFVPGLGQLKVGGII